MPLLAEELACVIDLRRRLHRTPEQAGNEAAAAGLLLGFISRFRPDEVITGLGGHGAAAVFRGPEPGPTVAFRAELDAVPVAEVDGAAHCSRAPGASHTCGHDGHAAIVAGVSCVLARRPVRRGRVVLLFQPSEETGEGAQRVIADPKFQRIKPDWIFALHNLPGHDRGQVLVRAGVFACASSGMVVELTGATSHAAHPEQARCPALAMCAIIKNLIALPRSFDFFTLVTVVHARLGEIAFGTTPGRAEIMATLRAAGDDQMQQLLAAARRLAAEQAARERLELATRFCDPFAALANDPAAVDLIRRAAFESGRELRETAEPFRWSDDFGRFTAVAKGAMFGLGAGRTHAPLHSPTYDFPHELIPMGVELFERILAGVSAPPEQERR
ncbi:MAG: amidohydrolase [Desulfobacterales bacterium]|jgi:amidohydrolase|nr:amidohydrolase [Desulfobacterales bacterium]